MGDILLRNKRVHVGTQERVRRFDLGAVSLEGVLADPLLQEGEGHSRAVGDAVEVGVPTGQHEGHLEQVLVTQHVAVEQLRVAVQEPHPLQHVGMPYPA